MNDKMTPNVRFKGFTDAWEQRKLGSYFEERKERSQNGELLSVTISSGIVEARSLDRKDNSSKDRSNYKIVKVNDIAYNSMRMWQGASGVSQYNGIVSPAYTVLIPLQGTCASFFGYMFKTIDMIHKFQINSQGLTSDTWNLKFKPLSQIKVYAPNEKEQSNSAILLDKLDGIIAHHQKKLEGFQLLKKLFLQKIFDQEWRFRGFTDPWEQRKLDEISKKVNKKNLDGSITETFTNSAEYGVVNQRNFFDKDISNVNNLSGYYVVQPNDFVYNPRISNKAPVGPIKRNKLGKTGIISPLYYVFSVHNIDKTFLEFYFDTSYWHKFMVNNGNSGARSDRFSIKDSILVTMPIPYPTLSEQQSVGRFLRRIINLIAHHQRELFPRKITGIKIY